MDANAYYLYLHRSIHFTGKAAWMLDAPMREHYRTVLPGHNAVAWTLWHIARGEDWAIQTILQGQEQLLTRDGWDTRMRVAEPSFGGGMERSAMVALSEQIDLDALRGYYVAVAAATQDVMRAFDFAMIDEPFAAPLDLPSRIALAPETAGPSPFLNEAFARWTSPQIWIEVFTLVDVAHHVEEADHVLKQLAPDRAVD